MGGAIPLHDHRAGAAGVRPCLRGATLVHVEVADRAPGVVVVGVNGSERGDPGTGRGDVGFDAAILAGSATGEVGHHFLSIAVNGELEAVVVGGTGGDDILGDCGTVDRLGPRSGVAGAEFEHVSLFARNVGIGVPHEAVEFRRAEIVLPSHVVTPGVGSHVGATTNRVLHELGVGRRGPESTGTVEDAFHHQVRSWRHAETPERAVVIHFLGAGVARHDACHVGAVAVLIACVGKAIVGEERIDATRHIRMHVGNITGIEA